MFQLYITHQQQIKVQLLIEVQSKQQELLEK